MGDGSAVDDRGLMWVNSRDRGMLELCTRGKAEIYGLRRCAVLQKIDRLELMCGMAVMRIFIGVRMHYNAIRQPMLVNKESGAGEVSDVHYKHQYIDYFVQPRHCPVSL